MVRTLASIEGVEAVAVVRRAVDWLEDAQMVVADLGADTDVGTLGEAFRGVDAVVHLAGANEVVVASRPEQAVAETLLATQRVAVAATEAGVRRLVYLSTVHVYGAALTDDAVISEDLVPQPQSPYASARLASEQVLAAIGDRTSVVILRLTNSVGAPVHPGVDRWTLISNDLCREAVTRGTVTLRTHGMQFRDFVAMTDVARVVAGVALSDRPPPGTYNLAAGRSITMRDLAALVQDSVERLSGRRPALLAPASPPQPPRPYTVLGDALAGSGYAPGDTLASAVDETVEFCTRWKEVLGAG